MASPLLGRRMLPVAAVEESPQASLHAGDTLQDDQIKRLCLGRVGGWARLGVGFEGGFGIVNRLAYHTVIHRAWCSREHCPDGSLPSSRQGVADQESLDVNDAYRF